jgi:CMP/dCMP kinase
MSAANEGGVQAVTLAREYGSGGGEIARRLAARLGWELLDHQIVDRVAPAADLTPGEAASLDERGESFVTRLLLGMEYASTSDSPLLVPDNPGHTYERAVRHLIEQAAASGRVVIVGRGGQLALAGRPDVCHVAVVAPLAARVAYVMRRESLAAGPAQARIAQMDHSRRQWVRDAYGQNGADPRLYDLVINTGALDLDAAVDLIALAVQRKGAGVAPDGPERGPAAGLPPYPAPPAPP